MRDVAGERPGQAEQPAGAGDERALDLGDAEGARALTPRPGRSDSTISVPPARAGPSTAAMIGLVRSRVDDAAEAARLVCRSAGVARVDRLEVGAGAEHVAARR